MKTNIKKVLVLGSGALKIGEAGEFDYSGSQALKALKEEGIRTVLINPNIATIQTSKSLADKIYFLPVNPYFVSKVIEKERPDGLFLSFGGQTALNCGLALSRGGILKKFNIQVLGTPVKSIELTEDRQLFAETLTKINVKTPRGGFATTAKQALEIARKLKYPLMIRSGFSLGGLGSAIVTTKTELLKAVNLAFQQAPQIAIEEYLKHWKEIEYEVVRDREGNKITVCNMENLDPLGVHTGESIVVAPSQTLSNDQYFFLRALSLKVIEHLKIIGECNIQFALDPKSNDYRVIEVNARLSRSSALASKATGYPLAYIAAKLSQGYLLPELKNSVTLSTSAFFEPALDYLIVKMPRWDLNKFIGAEDRIGSSMKSVGEVMSIARSFPEALQKGIRMLETNQDGLLNGRTNKHNSSLKKFLAPSTQRLFSVAQRLAEGTPISQIYHTTGIDPWFLHQIATIIDFETQLKDQKLPLNHDHLLQAKRLGFSDKLIAKAYDQTEAQIRLLRLQHKIRPYVKHIDTLAAEYPAKTNYLYLTYNASDSEMTPPAPSKHKAMVIGSGPYRIGSSVEFDWCSVTSAQTLRQKGYQTVMLNCNPETVSTDFDLADKLYFEELTFERVSDIYEIEGHPSLVLAFGGQVPNNLALDCYHAGYKILGTSPISIDSAEDRHKFSALLDQLQINQPPWQELRSIAEACDFGKQIGYPVLIRPSYVLSGSAMNVAYSPPELKKYLASAVEISREFPVVISKFIDNAKEIEMDGVAKNGQLVIYAISEHVENAGVHSGDATLVFPAQRLYQETMRQIKNATKKIIASLNIHGPFNIQYMAKDNQVMVIELNLRASRSFPFVSKMTGHNFAKLATEVLIGESPKVEFSATDLDYVGVKASQFSFHRITGADPKLRVEMASTGEVACFGEDLSEAYLKSLISTGWRLPEKGIFLSIGGDANKLDFLDSARKLQTLGLKIYATKGTSAALTAAKIKNTIVHKISDNRHPSTLDLIREGKIDLAINISPPALTVGEKDRMIIRRACIDWGVGLITNFQSAIAFAHAVQTKKIDQLAIKSWDEYTPGHSTP